MAELTGKIIGRYNILELIGEGGMSNVYRAHDARLKREVAFKVILSLRRMSEKHLKRFEREARVLAQLSHPNIIKIYDYGEHEGLPSYRAKTSTDKKQG